MKKAVILILHNRPEQANILIRQLLTDKELDIFVHIDKKNENNVLPFLMKNERVMIADNNIDVHWGSDELLKAVLNMYKLILSQDKEYEYVLMLTGSDLMVKKDLDAFLQLHKGEAFIDCMNGNPEYSDKFRRACLLHKWPRAYLNLYNNKYHPIRILRSLRLRAFMRFPNFKKKKVSFDTESIRFFYNYIWHAFPIEIVRYIVDFLDKNKGFWEIYEGSFMTDEGFHATVVMMSPYKDRIKFSNGRSRSLTYCKKGVNNHPPVLTTADIAEIDNDSMAYFARKFDSNVDKDVMNYYYMKVTGQSLDDPIDA